MLNQPVTKRQIPHGSTYMKWLFVPLYHVLSSVHLLRCVQLFSNPQTVAHQSPLSMGFSRQEYWNRLPCPPPWELPDPRIEPGSPGLQADSLPLSH